MIAPSESYIRHRRSPKLNGSPAGSTTPTHSPALEAYHDPENNRISPRVIQDSPRPTPLPSPVPFVLQPSRGSPFEALNEWIRSSRDGSSAQSRMTKVKTGILRTTHDLFKSGEPSRRSSLMTESERSWAPSKMVRAQSMDSGISRSPSIYGLPAYKRSRSHLHRSDSTSYPESVRTASRARKCLSACAESLAAESLADSGQTFPNRTRTYEAALRRMEDSLTMWKTAHEQQHLKRKMLFSGSLILVRFERGRETLLVHVKF